MTTLPGAATKGQSSRVALGSGASYSFNPATSPTGTAIATGDYLIVVLSASGNLPRVPTPDAGWTVVVPYATVSGGSAAFGIWLRIRAAGETAYTGALSTNTDATTIHMFWGSGVHPSLTGLVTGTAKARITATAETVTSTAPAITTTVANSVVIAICLERTTADETGTSGITAGWTQDLFSEDATNASATTWAIAHQDKATAGATTACVVTFPNSHANNGLGIQFALPPIPDGLAVSGAASLSGTGTLGAAGKPATAATATLAGSGTLGASGKLSGAATATLAGSGTLGASGQPALAATVALAGSGTLGVPTAVPRLIATVSLGGSGALTASGATQQLLIGSAALTGVGTLRISQVVRVFGSVDLRGSGQLVPSLARPQPTATVALTGSGALNLGEPKVVLTWIGRLSLSGSGLLRGVVTGGTGEPSPPTFDLTAGLVTPTLSATLRPDQPSLTAILRPTGELR